MTAAADPGYEPAGGRAAALWAGAAAVAIAAHFAAGWLALRQSPPEFVGTSPPPAVMIELAPEAVAPPAETQEFAPNTADAMEVEAPLETLAPPAPRSFAPDTPLPPPDLAPRDTPAELRQPQMIQPPTPPVVEPAIAAPPPPRPAPAQPPAPDAPKAPPKPVAKQKPMTKAKSNAVTPAPGAAAPKSGVDVASSAQVANWQSKLSAHLRRWKRYPPGAQARRETGVARVTFTLDANGNVLTAKLLRSTGFPDLDAEAAALLRRASPVPLPPPGAKLVVTVPVDFNLK